VTLERVTEAIEAETDAAWIRDVRDRYLAWNKTHFTIVAQPA